MNDMPHPAKRDVVVTLSDDDGRIRATWLLSIPSELDADEALAGCANALLPLAIEAGDIDPSEGSANFRLREADMAIDGDLYLQEASEAGPLN